MKTYPVWSIALAFACLLPLVRAADMPPGMNDFNAYVEKARTTFNVPGMAVAIVKDGHVVLAKGYGVKKLGEPDPVDENTLFAIASNTKAFTAAGLAILADEGKLNWDDPVIMHLPDFQMYDPYVTHELSVRDLIAHRSGLGLGEGDLLYFPHSTFTTEEIVYKLRFMKPASSFRSKYAYDNILPVVAGQVIAAVSGESWGKFTQERIFKPLGMTHSLTDAADIKPDDDASTPHGMVNGKLAPIPRTRLENGPSAGAIYSCVSDMAKWITMQLNGGALPDGSHIFTEKQQREMWAATTPQPNPVPTRGLEAQKSNFAAYGIGWNLRDYRGHKIVTHTGGLAGYVSIVLMVPDEKFGIVVLTNQGSTAAYNSVVWRALDAYTGDASTDWVEKYSAAARGGRGRRAGAAEAPTHQSLRDPNTKPSLALAKYAGTYHDAWYGDIFIAEDNGKLQIKFSHTPQLSGVLEHWQHDTFVARWSDPAIHIDAFITFTLTPDGEVAEAKMEPFSPGTDFSYDYKDLDLIKQ